MAKARKIHKFRCYRCKKNLSSSAASFQHFTKYPKHRSPKQRKDYLKNKAHVKECRDRAPDGLPTRRFKAVLRERVQKFCTVCGNKRMPSHRYCGGCGAKA